MKYYQELEKIYSRITNIENANSILAWDIAVNIPENSIETRAEQISELKNIAHEILVGNRLGDCLINIDAKLLDVWQLKNLELINTARNLALLLDQELIGKLTKATSISEMKWRIARKNNDFQSYLPYLAEVIKLNNEITIPKAEKLGCSIYDALIDNYEPNLSSKIVEPLFNKLEIFLKDFIPQVLEYQKTNNYQIMINHPEISDEVQFKLGKRFMDLLGFDFTRGRLDLSTHPQCGGYRDDTRITTRFEKNDLITGLMGVIHETGHALYSQNLPVNMRTQPVGSYIGMGMHESQSLIMEMQVARSKEFLIFASKQIKEVTGYNIVEFGAISLFKKINQVSPSLIRVDADEVTYSAHVIMRVKIEQKLITGELPLKDLPGVWAEEINNILGIKPTNDSEGCLQDIHWPSGHFGYFPSYTIGSIMASQFFATAKTQIPYLMDNIEVGKFKPLVNWLNNNIHAYGSLFNSEQLLKKVTDSYLKVDYYTNYLKTKFLNN